MANQGAAYAVQPLPPETNPSAPSYAPQGAPQVVQGVASFFPSLTPRGSPSKDQTGGGGGGGGLAPPVQAVIVGQPVVASVVQPGLYAPGYGEQEAWPQSSANPVVVVNARPVVKVNDHILLKMCATMICCVAVMGALVFVFLPFLDRGDEPPVADSADMAIGDTCPTPVIAHGALEVDASISQSGSDASSGLYFAGTAATVRCDPGFRRAAVGPSIILCWPTRDGTGAEWSTSLASITCASTQPPPPRPVVVQVRAQVLSPSETRDAESRMAAALATADRQPAGRAAVEEVTVASTVIFPVTIERIAEGSAQRADFESGFRSSMAQQLGGISSNNIVVSGISGGSIVVDWALIVPASVATEAASLVTTLASSGAGLNFWVGGQAISGDTSTIAAPVVTQEPNIDCVGTHAIPI